MTIRWVFDEDEALNTYLAVIIGQLLRPDNPVKIRLHKFLDDWDLRSVKSSFGHEVNVRTINLCKIFQRRWLGDIQNRNNLFHSVSWHKRMENGRMNKIGPSGENQEFVEWIPHTHILIHASLGEELEELELSQRPQAK